jgi:hypothetical protein
MIRLSKKREGRLTFLCGAAEGRPRGQQISRQIIGEQVCAAQKPPTPLRCSGVSSPPSEDAGFVAVLLVAFWFTLGLPDKSAWNRQPNPSRRARQRPVWAGGPDYWAPLANGSTLWT